MSEVPGRATGNRFAGDFYLLATILFWGNTFATSSSLIKPCLIIFL